MHRPHAAILAALLLIGCAQSPLVSGETAAPATPAAPVTHASAGSFNQRFEKDVKPLLAKHCYGCHGNTKKKGGINFEQPISYDTLKKDRKFWDSVREQVATRAMPPEEKPQLTQPEFLAVTTWLDEAFAAIDASLPPDPGFVAPHRLNRTEYNNTIRDLVGVDFKPAENFPADDAGYGFDNIADVLTM